MNQLLYIAFLIGGIVLLTYGITASHSVGSDFSRLFNGSPTDKAIWLMVGGGVLAAIGAGGLLRGSK